MRDFIARFNKLANRIPIARKPTVENQKMFFISSRPPDISFQIRRAHVANLQVAQTLEIELEDDLIAARKWKWEVQSDSSTSSISSVTINTEAIL